MKILSLFDGMACGALAMQAAGIEIDKYIAYEVDKYAIQTAQHNFPFIEERGDVFKADFTEYAGFDYLIGGSPCTYWSIAQTKNRETVASGMGWELFSQYVRALHEAKPRFFLYENNKSMSAAIRASITETFGFEPILINSALVSAQNRQRLYWCGIRQADGTYRRADIQQPDDRGILLKDILETGVTWQEAEPICLNRDTDKSVPLTASYFKYAATDSFKKANPRMGVAEPVCVAQRGRYDESGKVYQHYEAQSTGKTNNLTTVSKDNLIAEPINAMKYELKSVENKDDGVVGVLDMAGQEQIKRVYGTNGKCATLTTCQGGHREPKVFEKIAEPICVNSKSGRAGVEGLQPSLQDRVYDTAGKMPAVTTSFNPRIAEPLNVNEIKYCNDKNIAHICRPFGSKGKVITENGKAPTLMAAMGTGGGNGVYYAENKKIRDTTNAPIYEVKDGFITVKGKQYPIKLVDGFYIIRKLTVRECMRLQTVPEWYEWPVSKSQAYKMLGNGWTVEVIAHLLRGLK